jgi:predicted porin
MKKSLVALATLAATGAFAQSSVTISGIMDANYSSGKSYGQGYSLINQNGARTTTFKFNGVEDMGAGNKAKFQMEIQPLIIASDGNNIVNYGTNWGSANATNTTSQAAAAGFQSSGLAGKGDTYVGLEGAFGDIRFGTNNSASLAAHSNGAGLWGTGVGSGYGSTIVGSTSSNTFTRFESSLVYITPTINGFTGRYLTNFKNDSQYGASTTGTTARRPAISEFGAQYLTGPLQLNLALLTSKASPNETVTGTTVSNSFTPIASNITTKTTTMSASYDLGVARLGYTNSKIANDAGFDVTNGSVPTAANLTTTPGKTQTTANIFYGQIPMGQARFLVASGQQRTDASPVPTLIGKTNTINSFGVEYDLSKRTYLYARTWVGKNNAANCATTVVVSGTSPTCAGSATTTTGGSLAEPKLSLTAIGVSHAF